MAPFSLAQQSLKVCCFIFFSYKTFLLIITSLVKNQSRIIEKQIKGLNINIIAKEKNISDVLNMTVKEAYAFFKDYPIISKKLEIELLESAWKKQDKTDKAVEAVEPGMLHHTFDQDPENPLVFVWSEAYKNDEAFIAHLANPAIGEYLQEHPKLADDFTVEVYGTVGDKCLEVMKGTGVPFKVFQSKLGYSRL